MTWPGERRGLSSPPADMLRVSSTLRLVIIRSHLLNDDLEADPQGWLDAAEEKLTLNTPR